MHTAAERERSDKVIARIRAGGIEQAAHGYVYFALCGAFIKIGHAYDVNDRMATLQTGNPHEITLLAAVPGTQRAERSIHAQFVAHRHRGEWFHDHAELRLYILEQTTTRAIKR